MFLCLCIRDKNKDTVLVNTLMLVTDNVAKLHVRIPGRNVPCICVMFSAILVFMKFEN